MALRALARVNLAAIERNVARLRSGLTGGAELIAVVKGNGYGHGALPAARAALAGGARSLAVATAGEAAELRAGGIDGPVLVMGAVSDEELPVALEARGELVAWSESFVGRLARVCRDRDRGGVAGRRGAAVAGSPGTVRVHVKLDTGMGRLGTRDAGEAIRVAESIAAAAPALELAGAMTHFASADEDPSFTAAQLGRFAPFVDAMRERWPGIVVHAANSAATLREPASHYDLRPLRDRDLRLRPDERGSRRARPRAGARADLVRRGREARARRRQRRLRAAVGRGRRDLGRDGADRLRRRDPPGADEQLRRADRRPALSGGGDGQHGQHHR